MIKVDPQRVIVCALSESTTYTIFVVLSLLLSRTSSAI